MNRRGSALLVLVLLLAAVLLGVGSWYAASLPRPVKSLGSAVATSTQVSPPSAIATSGGETYDRLSNVPTARPSVYANHKLGFSFDMPQGYRLATSTMEFLNAIAKYPIANWSPSNAEDVVITASTPSDEQNFLIAAELGSTSTDDNPVADLARSIYIAGVAPTLATIESTLAKLKVLHPNIVQTSDVQHIVISNAEGIRYTVYNASSGDIEEVVYIAFPAASQLPSGLPVGTIMVDLNKNANHDDSPLNTLLATFKFN